MSRWHRHEWDLLPIDAFIKKPGGNIKPQGGGSAPAPDPLIGEAARLNAETASKALDWYQGIYQSDLLPIQQEQLALSKQVTASALEDAKANREFAAEQRDDYRTTWRPIEQQVAADAAGYDSDENVERRSGMAAASVNQQFSNSAAQKSRLLARYGLNPNSSAFAAEAGKDARTQALASASAQTSAAFETQDKAIALRAGAANFGRNMPNTSAQALSGSGASSGLALNSMNSGLQSAINTASFGGQGFTTAINGYNSAGGMMATKYNADMQKYSADQASEAATWQGVGAVAGMAAMAFASDRRLKRDIRLLGRRGSLNVYAWRYVWDSPIMIGHMADEVSLVIPEAVLTMDNGFQAVNYRLVS